MLEQIFNNPDAAKIGLMVSGPIILAGAGGLIKAAGEFNKHKFWGKAGSLGAAFASLAIAGGGGFVAWEAWPRADGPGRATSNAPIVDTFESTQPIQP